MFLEKGRCFFFLLLKSHILAVVPHFLYYSDVIRFLLMGFYCWHNCSFNENKCTVFILPLLQRLHNSYLFQMAPTLRSESLLLQTKN